MMSLTLTATCLSAFAAELPLKATSWENRASDLTVVNIAHLADNDLQEITQGQHPETAVQFSARTILPITFFLKGDLVNLLGNEQTIGAIEIKQTFYARCVEKELIFSTNLTDWKSLPEFITGNASIVLKIEEGQPSLVLGAETNYRS